MDHSHRRGPRHRIFWQPRPKFLHREILPPPHKRLAGSAPTQLIGGGLGVPDEHVGSLRPHYRRPRTGPGYAATPCQGGGGGDGGSQGGGEGGAPTQHRQQCRMLLL